MLLSAHRDPMGQAIRDHFETGHAARLVVRSSMFDDDEMPVSHLFRTPLQMNALEQRALDMSAGRVLDVGAGAGCHALALQQRGLEVTAIDVSPLSVETMRRRGVRHALLADFLADDCGGPYDTILLLMNGMGICGTLARLPLLLSRLDALLAPGGRVLTDATDLRYVFEDEDGHFDPSPQSGAYYGEVDYRMYYKRVCGPRFSWLYLDFHTLYAAAAKAGFAVRRVLDGPHYDYLAELRRADRQG